MHGVIARNLRLPHDGYQSLAAPTTVQMRFSDYSAYRSGQDVDLLDRYILGPEKQRI